MTEASVVHHLDNTINDSKVVVPANILTSFYVGSISWTPNVELSLSTPDGRCQFGGRGIACPVFVTVATGSSRSDCECPVQPQSVQVSLLLESCVKCCNNLNGLWSREVLKCIGKLLVGDPFRARLANPSTPVLLDGLLLESNIHQPNTSLAVELDEFLYRQQKQ